MDDGARAIDWPERLLRIARQHMEAVEHSVAPRIPPLSATDAQPSALTLLVGLREDVRSRTHATDSVLDCCQNLVLDMIEQCCASSFLCSKERRVIAISAVQREKRMEGRHAPKRRKTDGDMTTSSSQHKCTAVLPAEYLLRFFLALPSILTHYDKLGGCVMPEAYKQPLWDYVNAVLQSMKDMPFFDVTAYVPLK